MWTEQSHSLGTKGMAKFASLMGLGKYLRLMVIILVANYKTYKIQIKKYK
jgi:hypothetical protein